MRYIDDLRHLEYVHNKRKREIASYGHFFGPYIKNGVFVANDGKGKHSKWLKKQSNKQVRKVGKVDFYKLDENYEIETPFISSNLGDYKKHYNYWWSLL